MNRILVAPLVTEKATASASVSNTYVFRVSVDANKIEIKNAVEARFPDVKVKEVRTSNVKGKRKMHYTKTGRFNGKKSDWKKAIVALQDGYSLDLYAVSE